MIGTIQNPSDSDWNNSLRPSCLGLGHLETAKFQNDFTTRSWRVRGSRMVWTPIGSLPILASWTWAERIPHLRLLRRRRAFGSPNVWRRAAQLACSTVGVEDPPQKIPEFLPESSVSRSSAHPKPGLVIRLPEV